MTAQLTQGESGFTFDSLVLRELTFVDTTAIDEASLHGARVGLDFTVELDGEGRRGRTRVRLELLPPDENPKLFGKFSVAIEAQFTALGATTVELREFAHKNAPAILFPFLREIVANVTSRSRFGQFVLPPLNVMAMIEEAEKGTAAGARG